jgi:NAD(P)-dependent dehydrogenase (short-subunit alcohol dehydrogenase family)
MAQGNDRLRGKSAVVTGAAMGIGRATAELFAAEGARLVLTDIQGDPLLALADELRSGGTEVETVVGDVSVEEDARRMIAAAADRFGRLDVLVANAGVIPLGDVMETTTADWDRVMAVDGRGMFLTCKFAIEAMLPTGGGAIVCLSSISGVAGQKRQAAYGPAKFVATGLTMHLAVEWADRGIRVNAVAPGTIQTEAVAKLREEPSGAEYVADIERMHPMGRLGDPAEVATAIAFLASEEASFITGAVLPVDGGFLAQ